IMRPRFIVPVLAICAFAMVVRGNTTPTLGTVVLEFYVDEKGAPTDIRVIESTDARYSQAAVRAVTKLKLSEKFRNQKLKVPVHFTVPPEEVVPPDTFPKRNKPNQPPQPTRLQGLRFSM